MYESSANTPFLLKFYDDNKEKTLLNAGIFGGKREVVLEFINKMLEILKENNYELGETDMGILNYVAYTYFKNRLCYSKPVCTEFRKWSDDGISWFQHK